MDFIEPTLISSVKTNAKSCYDASYKVWYNFKGNDPIYLLPKKTLNVKVAINGNDDIITKNIEAGKIVFAT